MISGQKRACWERQLPVEGSKELEQQLWMNEIASNPGVAVLFLLYLFPKFDLGDDKHTR